MTQPVSPQKPEKGLPALIRAATSNVFQANGAAADRVAAELPLALAQMLPGFLTLFIGFVVLWLNILFLLSMALVPFPTALLVR